jgi:anti-sigma-K factor RskA
LEEHIFDLLPGYALGCLDDEELLQVARHLPDCAICRAELSTYWAAVDQIAVSTPLQTPRVDLKSKILQRISGGAQPSVAVPHPILSPTRQRGLLDSLRSLFSRPVGFAFGALALLLLIFMTASTFLLWQRVNDLQARVPPANVQLVRMAGTTNAPQARGYLMVFQNETYGTLVVENAPPLPAGYQYQLWLVRDGKRTSGGTFSVSDVGYGVLDVWSKQPLGTYPSFGITIEPAGGSPAPTGKKVLGGDL